MESKMDAINSPVHEVISYRRPVEVDAAMKELVPGESNSESRHPHSTCACVQLANGVFNPSFIQDLCKLVGFKAITENKVIDLRALLYKGSRTTCMVDRETGRVTRDDSRKAQFICKGRGEDMCEELVEMILSRIPFPYVFKTTILSKSWFFKLPLQSVKPLQPTFQNLVSSMSSQWPTYCPAYMTASGLFCFDRHSFEWKPLVRLSYLTGPLDCLFFDILSRNASSPWPYLTAGPLLCFFNVSKDQYTVTNVITKGLRNLPNSVREAWDLSHIRLLQVDSAFYKLILVYLTVGETHVYHSSLKMWTVSRFSPCGGTLFSNSAYLDKKLYCLNTKDEADYPCTLWTYQVEDDAWLMPTSQSFLSREIRESAILLCGDKVMAAIWFQTSDEGITEWLPPDEPTEDGASDEATKNDTNVSNKIGIFQLNLDTRQLEEVSRGPPRSLIKDMLDKREWLWCDPEYSSDTNFIYVAVTDDATYGQQQVMSYNVHSHVWECIPSVYYDDEVERHEVSWMEAAFEPGLNPFMFV